MPAEFRLQIVAADGIVSAGNGERTIVMHVPYYEARLKTDAPGKMDELMKRNNIKSKLLLADGTLPISNSSGEGLAMLDWPTELSSTLRKLGVIVSERALQESIDKDDTAVSVVSKTVTRER